MRDGFRRSTSAEFLSDGDRWEKDGLEVAGDKAFGHWREDGPHWETSWEGLGAPGRGDIMQR